MNITEKILLKHCKKLFKQHKEAGFWFELGATMACVYKNPLCIQRKCELRKVQKLENGWTTALLECEGFGTFRISINTSTNEVLVLEQW